jgi:tetratricopeptide (TPR) repeat protein
MAVDPDERFRRAADAARALPVGGDLAQPVRSDVSSDEDIARIETASDGRGELPRTITLGPTVAETTAEQPTETVVEEPAETVGDGNELDTGRQTRPSDGSPNDAEPAGPRLVDDQQMVPEEWRPADADEMPRPLIGTGLGLFGLREAPFVDRDTERARIWEALRSVEQTGRPHSVLVAGRSGAGKSRLIDWMATRAHELGAATVFRALHTPGGNGPAEGLAGMVRRMCGAWKLDRDELYEYFREHLPAVDAEDSFRDVDARALTELLEPTDDSVEVVDGPRYRFSSPSQKFELLTRLIRRYGRNRPPIVWLDDIQWGEQAVGLVEHLLDDALEPPSALIAVSYRSEEVAENGELCERIDAVAESARSCRIQVASLAADDHRHLVDEMLPFEPELAERVATRTEGNPLFASQLIGEWIERSEIEPGPDGFRLTGEVGVGVPDDIHGLWMVRIDRLIADLGFGDPTDVWRALERVAALGREVDGREWQVVCDQIGLEQTGRLGSEMIDRGLAEDTPDGWAFGHGMLVESLERMAREAGRWEQHHRQCVALLQDLYADQPERFVRRVAEHWIEAGEPERALEPLLREAERLYRRGNPIGQRRILRRRQQILDDLDVPRSSPRRIENDLAVGRAGVKLASSLGELRATLEDAIERAEAGGHDDLIARGAQLVTLFAQKRGQFEESVGWGKRALEAGRRADDDRALSRAYGTLGWTEFIDGDLDSAARCFERSREHAKSAGSRYLELKARGKAAWVSMAERDVERAKREFQQTAREAREAGYRALEANCMNALGDMARFDGDISQARSHYERYLELYEELSDLENLLICRVNIALLDLADGQYETAADEFEELEELLGSITMGARLQRHVALGGLVLEAVRGEWADFDSRLASLEDGWREWSSVAEDYPWLLEMAAEQAEQRGHHERADRCRRFARELWCELGDDEAVARLDDQL